MRMWRRILSGPCAPLTIVQTTTPVRFVVVGDDVYQIHGAIWQGRQPS
jgi:hypothetical protein